MISSHEKDKEPRGVDRVVRSELRKFFTSHKASERGNMLIKRLEKYDFISDSDIARAKEILHGIESCKTEEDFIEIATQALKPLISYIAQDPNAFQLNAQRRAFEGNNNNPEKINELLYFHQDDMGRIHLHVLPNMFTSRTDLLSLLRQGFSEFAHRIEFDDTVNDIYATSWIIAENPKLLELLGFTMVGPISEDEKARYFAGETRDIWRAVISKEEFIAKHLK